MSELTRDADLVTRPVHQWDVSETVRISEGHTRGSREPETTAIVSKGRIWNPRGSEIANDCSFADSVFFSPCHWMVALKGRSFAGEVLCHWELVR